MITDIRREINVFVNRNTQVIVREPVHHEFDGSFDYCSNRLLKIIDEMN